MLILEGALCILTAPARLQPPVRDPPAAQTHGVAAGHMGWSWGRGNTFQNGRAYPSSGGWLSWRTGSQKAEGGVGRGPNAGTWTSPRDMYYYTSYVSESCRIELQLHSDTALCVTKNKDTPTRTHWSPITHIWTNLGVLVGRAGFVTHLLPPNPPAEVLPPSTTGSDCVRS